MGIMVALVALFGIGAWFVAACVLAWIVGAVINNSKRKNNRRN